MKTSVLRLNKIKQRKIKLWEERFKQGKKLEIALTEHKAHKTAWMKLTYVWEIEIFINDPKNNWVFRKKPFTK